MSESDFNEKEWRILQAVKGVLVKVAKETAVPPGTRHPLSQQTIGDIRQCMGLISSREMELRGDNQEISKSRPKYPDQQSSNTKVSVTQIMGNKPAKK